MTKSFLSRFTPSLMSPETLEQILVQRHELAADLMESIQDSILTEAKHFRLLIGPRGIGKTHMIALLYHRIKAEAQRNLALGSNLWLAWLREEEWGIASFLDLILRIFRALEAEYPQIYENQLKANVDHLYNLSLSEAEYQAQALLLEFISNRTLLILAENLGDLFEGLGDSGQKQFRAYIQNHHCLTMVATAQSLFGGVQDRDAPFYSFFRVDYLDPLSFKEVIILLKELANLMNNDALSQFLQTPVAENRVRAIHQLAGGNPRVYVIFSQFLTRDQLDELVDAFMQTLDDLTPYYQSRMTWISPQQRKIVEYLVDIRRAAPVKEIAQQCFITHQTASSQLKDLVAKGYVRSDPSGRESWYELQELLMRFCLEVKKQRGEPIRLFVDFLRLWYTRDELEQRYRQLTASLEIKPDLDKASLELDYLSDALRDMNNASFWYTQGLSLANQGKHEEAVGSFDRAIALDPSDVSLWNYRGSSLHDQGRYEEAVGSYDRALALNQNNAKVWNNRGVGLANQGRHEEAIGSYDQALALDQNYLYAWNNRGVSLDDQGRYEEAIESYDQALALNPNDAITWYNRGVTLSKQGRHEEAIGSFDRAIALDPSNVYAWVNRGKALGKLNRHLEALDNNRQAFHRLTEAERKECLPLLSQQLTQAIPTLIHETTSQKTAQDWLETWQTLAGDEPIFQIALRLLTVAVQYKGATDDKQKRRLLLSLAAEERQIFKELVN